MTYQWDNKKPTAQMLGRWQPFHDGHYTLFKEIIKKTGQVCIQIRDVQGVDDNPFDFETVKKNIEEKLNSKGDYLSLTNEQNPKKASRTKSKNTKSRNKYKRVALSTIRYAGGKSLAVGHIFELLPNHVKRVVSPFFGGGSVEIAMSKFLGLNVVGYDIFDILCNYWNFQIKKPEILFKRLNKLKPTFSEFERIRKILNKVWKKEVKLDPLTLAVYYVYNFNLSLNLIFFLQN